MRGKRLVEEAATERFSTWPWATHQTELKRVLFIIVVWLSVEPWLSVCQSRPFSLLSSATCPLPDVFMQCRKDAALSPLHSRTAPWGSGEVEGCKQAQNSFPHMCSASSGVHRLRGCLCDCRGRHRQSEGSLNPR